MKFKSNRAPAAVALALSTGLAHAQGGHMMDGGGWFGGGMGGWMGSWMGGYGGLWVPVLLVLIVGLLVWLVMQRRK